MTTTTLLPCPFCGGSAESDTQRCYVGFNHKLRTAAAIYCLKCSADLSMCREDFPQYAPNDLLLLLTEAWNCRVNPELTQLQSQNAQLKEALEKADNALKICFADSSAVNVEVLTEKGFPMVGNIIENIKKWSGAYKHCILKALAATPAPERVKKVEHLEQQLSVSRDLCEEIRKSETSLKEQLTELRLQLAKVKSELMTEELQHTLELNQCHNELNEARRVAEKAKL